MCGIVGIYLKSRKFEKDLGKMLSGMLINMESRGPDSAGFAIYKKEKKEEFKYSICINNLAFEKFKNGITGIIKFTSIFEKVNSFKFKKLAPAIAGTERKMKFWLNRIDQS